MTAPEPRPATRCGPGRRAGREARGRRCDYRRYAGVAAGALFGAGTTVGGAGTGSAPCEILGIHPSDFGSHQLRSPSSVIVAGSRTPRMIVPFDSKFNSFSPRPSWNTSTKTP